MIAITKGLFAAVDPRSREGSVGDTIKPIYNIREVFMRM